MQQAAEYAVAQLAQQSKSLHPPQLAEVPTRPAPCRRADTGLLSAAAEQGLPDTLARWHAAQALRCRRAVASSSRSSCCVDGKHKPLDSSGLQCVVRRAKPADGPITHPHAAFHAGAACQVSSWALPPQVVKARSRVEGGVLYELEVKLTQQEGPDQVVKVCVQLSSTCTDLLRYLGQAWGWSGSLPAVLAQLACWCRCALCEALGTCTPFNRTKRWLEAGRSGRPACVLRLLIPLSDLHPSYVALCWGVLLTPVIFLTS